MAQHPCPICGRPVDPATTTAMPFCSPRCRRIDLARWLGERYQVPVVSREPEEASSEEPAPPAGDAAADQEEE